MGGPAAEPVSVWKGRILRHCGLPPASAAAFGLALGNVVLDEAQSAAYTDICNSDTLTLFQRDGGAAVTVAAAVAAMAACLGSHPFLAAHGLAHEVVVLPLETGSRRAVSCAWECEGVTDRSC